jgi:hypothetical protein
LRIKIRNRAVFALVFLTACLTSSRGQAGSLLASHSTDSASRGYLLAENSDLADHHLLTGHPAEGRLFAETDGDDAYDPFADYSEFEEAADEEEDINFFRNGRLLTIGLVGGARFFTGNLQSIYQSSGAFGLYLCYFFDLRFALQIGFMTSDHSVAVAGQGATPQNINGTVNLTDLSFNLKYYFNTQNVTRGLADLNPYLISGVSQIFRTYMIQTDPNLGKDAAFAFNLGAGIEVPILRNKMYIGGQGMFQYINFADANVDIPQPNGQPSGVKPFGSSYTLLAILGVNF